MEQELTQNLQLKTKKHRYWELDFLRGLCVILMVFDHVLYSIGGVAPMIDATLNTTLWVEASNWVWSFYWYHDVRIIVRLLTLFCFFFICGISCSLSRSNLKRGALCFLVGCGITFFTVLFDRIVLPDRIVQAGQVYRPEDLSIYFGVLHMLGISMMLYGLIDKLGALIAKIGKNEKTKKATKIIGDYLAPTIGLVLLIVYFSCFFSAVEYGVFVTDVVIEDKSTSVIVSLFLNIRSDYLGGADYWPLLPWVGIVLIGGFVGRGIYKTKAKDYLAPLDGKWNKPVCFVGRHALVVYVVHQVAALALIYLITLIAG